VTRALASASFAPVTIDVVPPEGASVTVSVFEPDESFPPGTVFLPTGKPIVVSAIGPGGARAEKTITAPDRTAQRIEVDLTGGPSAGQAAGGEPHRPPTPGGQGAGAASGPSSAAGDESGAAAAGPPDAASAGGPGGPASGAELGATSTAPRRSPRHGALTWSVLGVAGAALVTGGVLHVLAWQRRTDLADAETGPDWDRYEPSFDRRRWGAIAAYGVAAAAGALGAYLWWRDGDRARDDDRSVRVSGGAEAGGASISVEWRR
jgi:hypothetical protein